MGSRPSSRRPSAVEAGPLWGLVLVLAEIAARVERQDAGEPAPVAGDANDGAAPGHEAA